MRTAMGVISYWSIFAALFLLAATCFKFRKDARTTSIEGGYSSEFSRVGKASPIFEKAKREPVLQPEDALSVLYEDESQVSAPQSPRVFGLAPSVPVRTTALSVTTEESLENGDQEPTFYSRALRETSGIYNGTLGPSGRFVESMASPEQQYLRHGARREGQSSTSHEIHSEKASLSMTPATQRSSAQQQAQHRPVRTAQRLQLLNFEASHQSIFHGLVPVGLGLSLVRESSDPTPPDEYLENDSESNSDEDEVQDASQGLTLI